MNSVHDRVQTVTQKHHRVENQVEKQSRVHEHPTSPAGPACAPMPRARGRVVGGPGRVVAGPPGRVAALLLPRAPPAARLRAQLPARLPPAEPARPLLAQRAHAHICCTQHSVVAWLAVSRPCVATQSSSPLSQLSQYNFCIVIQIFPHPAFLPQYKTLYCNTISCSPASCNTNPAIQS